jgi:hypothetical protein
MSAAKGCHFYFARRMTFLSCADKWLPIAEPGLLAKDGVIQVNPDTTLPVSDGDFLVLRPLVNRYRKASVQ